MYRADEEYPRIKRFCRWLSDAAQDYLWESHEQQKGLSTKMVEAELEPADFRQRPTTGVLRKVPALIRYPEESPPAPDDGRWGRPKPRFNERVDAVSAERAGEVHAYDSTVPDGVTVVHSATASRLVGGRTGLHGDGIDEKGTTRAAGAAGDGEANAHQQQPEGNSVGVGQRRVVAGGGERVGRITRSLFAPLPFEDKKASVHIT